MRQIWKIWGALKAFLIAKALLNARVGAVVTVRSPRGDRQLEVVRIAYEPA